MGRKGPQQRAKLLTQALISDYDCLNPNSERFHIGEDSLKPEEITEFLNAWSGGEREKAEHFMPIIYNELRRQAHRFLNRERPNHTLQTTALVHEVYLRLKEQENIAWKNREHFFGMAGQMMRRILVNYAVSRKRDKRGGANETVPLDEATFIAFDEGDADVIALDDALKRLEKFDERQVRIIELRYFSGLSVEETASALQISPRTVKREWQMAKAWLRAEIGGRQTQ